MFTASSESLLENSQCFYWKKKITFKLFEIFGHLSLPISPMWDRSWSLPSLVLRERSLSFSFCCSLILSSVSFTPFLWGWRTDEPVGLLACCPLFSSVLSRLLVWFVDCHRCFKKILVFHRLHESDDSLNLSRVSGPYNDAVVRGWKSINLYRKAIAISMHVWTTLVVFLFLSLIVQILSFLSVSNRFKSSFRDLEKIKKCSAEVMWACVSDLWINVCQWSIQDFILKSKVSFTLKDQFVSNRHPCKSILTSTTFCHFLVNFV